MDTKRSNRSPSPGRYYWLPPRQGRDAFVFVWFVVLMAGCSTEPVWKGKSLSHWLGQMNDVNEQRSRTAEMALRRIGTNAIPYLLPKLTAPEASVDEWLDTQGRAEAERTGAVLAFRVLGKSGARWLPALNVLLTNRAELDPAPIAQSMAGIGEQAIPWLVAGLNCPRPDVRRASLIGLIDLGQKAREAMPSVMERLRDGDAEVRGLALFFVRDVSDDREIKLRVFKEASRDPDREVRSLAEKELNRLDVN